MTARASTWKLTTLIDSFDVRVRSVNEIKIELFLAVQCIMVHKDIRNKFRFKLILNKYINIIQSSKNLSFALENLTCKHRTVKDSKIQLSEKKR